MREEVPFESIIADEEEEPFEFYRPEEENHLSSIDPKNMKKCLRNSVTITRSHPHTLALPKSLVDFLKFQGRPADADNFIT